MSRRRAADGPLLDNDDEESQILDTSSNPINTKPRSPIERIGRFARQRPVTSLLALILISALCVITLAVTRTAIAAFSVRSGIQDAVQGVQHDGDGAIIDVVTEHEPPAGVSKTDQDNSASKLHATSMSGSTKCRIAFTGGKLGARSGLCVTREYFFDIKSGEKQLGTVRIGVFGNVVPKSAANFHALATCTGAFADTALCFRGDAFHRIVRGFVAQGGSKATGKSIYGATFREEFRRDHHSFLQHAEQGVVAWAEYPIGSQFYVLFANQATYLDKNHVVFGIVTKGWHVFQQIGTLPLVGERPVEPLTIANCGEVDP